MSLLCPYKRQISMLHSFTSTCKVRMNASKAWYTCGETICYTNYQFITITWASVESPHYLAWFVLCNPIVITNRLHVFDPCKTFCLRCKCAPFIGSRARGNAINRSIEIDICLLWWQRRDIYEKSSALITTFLI